MNKLVTCLAAALPAALASAASGAEAELLDDLPEHFGVVMAIAAGAILCGSLAQIWINRLVAATVAAAASAGAAWLLLRQIEIVGATAVTVFLVTLVLVKAIFDSWRE